MLLVLCAATLGAGYLWGVNGLGQLRIELTESRDALDRLREENGLLVDINRRNGERLQEISGIVGATKTSLDTGIRTVGEALGLVRKIRSRLQDLENAINR